MNILYVVSSLKKTGLTKIIFNTIKYHKPNHSKNKIFVLTIKKNDKASYESELRAMGVTILSLNSSARNVFKNAMNIRDVYNRFCIDIIHAHCFSSILACSFLPSSYIKVCTSHSYIPFNYKGEFGSLKGFLFSRLIISRMKKYNRIISVSNSVMELYSSRDYIKTSVIRNGVENENENENENESEKKYDFIYAGSISYRKQVRLLCESFFEYNKERKYNLCILGDGPDLLELKDKYQSEHILFKGSVGNVFAYLNQSKFFISPSLSEGLPNAVLEAYSLGLPCLLSNIGPHMELASGCDVLEKLSFNINKADIVRSLTLANRLSSSDCSLASIFEKNLISSELNALIMSNKHFDLYEEVILFNGK